MLAVHQLSKSFGIDLILNNVSFTLNRGDRLGLIGVNGCGKSTLLRIIAGIFPPDSGSVHFSPGSLRVGYLAQGFEPPPNSSLNSLLAEAVGDPVALENQLSQLSTALMTTPEDAALQQAYDQTLNRLSRYDAGKIPPLLAAFGLDHLDGEMPAFHLSGGQKTRLAMALILLNQPDLLLLDEPTNHLDIEMLEWLEQWLQSFDGGVLLVSHDRTFLDETANRILAFDVESREVREYAGNYTAYLEQVLKAHEKRWSQYKDQVYEIRRMKQDIARVKEKAKRKEAATKNDAQRRYAKKVAKLAKSREKKLERYIDSEDRVTRPKRVWQVNVQFETNGHLGKDVLELVDLTVGYSAEAPLLSNLDLRIQAGEQVVLTGANGSGKTTLLRTLMGEVAPIDGSFRLGHSVQVGYMSQEQEGLDPDKSALETVMENAGMNETDARNYLHHYLFKDDDPLRPTSHLSYGERARLWLAVLVLQGCNFLILDEPINHLDIPSRTLFEQALKQFNGTTLAVVHDRYFIQRFATTIWWAEDGQISKEWLT